MHYMVYAIRQILHTACYMLHAIDYTDFIYYVLYTYILYTICYVLSSSKPGPLKEEGQEPAVVASRPASWLPTNRDTVFS